MVIAIYQKGDQKKTKKMIKNNGFLNKKIDKFYSLKKIEIFLSKKYK